MSQIPYPVGSEIYNMATTGSATGAPQGLSMGQMGGMLNLANMFLGQSAMRNTMGSMAQAQQTAGLFGESDLERQMRVARYAPKFSVNDPSARQFDTKNNLLAGKYAFDAFVS